MNVGVVLGWINIFLLAVAGLLAILRWKRLRWFPVYALAVSSLAIIGRFFFYTHEFYLFKDYIGNFLALIALAEAWRVDTRRSQSWVLLVLPFMIITPFLDLPLALRYQLPQEALVVAMALILPLAVRKKSYVLVGWGIFGLVTVVLDIVTSLFPRFDWPVLQLLYPMAFLSMNLVWMWYLLAEERVKAYAFLTGRMQRWGLWPRPVERAPQTEVGGNGNKPAPELDDSIALHLDVQRSSNVEQLFPRYETGESGEVMKRLDAIEAAVEAAAMLSFRMRKTFLSPVEIALYLGTTEKVAREFVEYREIPTLTLTEDPDQWVVFRKDIDGVLETELERKKKEEDH